MKLKLKIISTALLFFAWHLAFAAASTPQNMLQEVANQLISELQANKAKLNQDPSIVYNVVIKTVLPHVDQEKMARMVVSREVWQNATQEQRDEFIKEFRTLVIKTYSAAFSGYTNETVQFKPIRGVAGNEVDIQSEIIRPGKPSIPVSYRLELENSNWKICDFSVEGVSMINSFRAQFASYAQQGMGALIKQLQQHNARTA